MLKLHWRYCGIFACLVGIALVLAWSASSWILIVKYWHISVLVTCLLFLRIYKQWRQEQVHIDQVKIEVLCLLDEAQRPLNQLQLMRLIDDEEVLARLPGVLELLVETEQIERSLDRAQQARYQFRFARS